MRKKREPWRVVAYAAGGKSGIAFEQRIHIGQVRAPSAFSWALVESSV
jgi:hypothetical protein